MEIVYNSSTIVTVDQNHFRCYVALKFGGSSSSIVDGLVHVAIMFTPNMENKTFNYIFSRCRESLGVS